MSTTLFMAISVNGMIAGADGSEDFLSNLNWKEFCNISNSSGGFVWGRKTYERVKDWGEEYFKPLENVKKVILTTNAEYHVNDGYYVATSPQHALNLLHELGVENIIITGGSAINTEFMKAGLIDQIILNIEPAMLGNGIPLFKVENFYNRLMLESTKRLEDGILQVTYSVVE